MNRSISTSDPVLVIVAFPMRSRSESSISAARAPFRSGTASASASRRCTPVGSPCGSTSIVRSVQSRQTAVRKVRRPLSQPVNAVASNLTLRSGGVFNSRSASPADGGFSFNCHGPESRITRVESAVRVKSTLGLAIQLVLAIDDPASPRDQPARRGGGV